MILNANKKNLHVESEYWQEAIVPEGDLDENGDVQKVFDLQAGNGQWTPQSPQWRTETFAWIREDLASNMALTISDETSPIHNLQLNGPEGDNRVSVPKEDITALVSYIDENNKNAYFTVSSFSKVQKKKNFSTNHQKANLIRSGLKRSWSIRLSTGSIPVCIIMTTRMK